MVYLLNMVIFHGKLLNNQMVDYIYKPYIYIYINRKANYRMHIILRLPCGYLTVCHGSHGP